MKKIKLVAFLLVTLLVVSCSSDSSSDNSSQEYFNYKTDGQQVTIPVWTALKSENSMEVLGQAPDGSSIYVSFNTFGDLTRVGSTPATNSNLPWRDNSYEFSSNNFNFELVSIDETNKKVKVNFSGKLYDDEFDITSDFSVVEGSFYVTYTDVTPQIAGLGIYAKIQGNDWHSVKATQTNNGAFDNVVLEENSDDEYKLSFYINHYDTTTGTYTFNGSSTNDKIILSRYNVTTNEYVDYICTGTMVLNEKVGNIQYNLISGTFNLTATNPIDNTQIQVTNGTFKDVYTY